MGGEARPRSARPSGTAVAGTRALAAPAADLLCLLAGDAWLDGRGYAQMALIRDFLEPFAAGGLDQALATVVHQLASATGSDRCTLFLRNEEGTHLVLAACAGPCGSPVEAPPTTPLPVAELPEWVREAESLGHSVAMTGSRRAPRRLPGSAALRRLRQPAATVTVARADGSRRRSRAPVPLPEGGLARLPWDARPVMAIPLAACGQAIGILFLDGNGQRFTLTQEHLRLGNILGSALGPAIGAARAHRRDPPHAPPDFRHLDLALNGSPDPDAVIQMAAEMGLEAVGAQLCVAVSLHDGSHTHLRSASVWPEGSFEVGADLLGHDLVAKALQSGRPVWLEEGVRDPCLSVGPPEARPALRAGIAVPLRDGDAAAGVILACHDHPHAYSAEDLRALMTLASHAEAALHNCVLYERQRSVTETVQRSFAPELPAEIEGIEVGQAFFPKTDQVGGDHYDLIPMGGGRIGILIGDVAGSGLRAAIHTNMARYMARALTFEHPDPGTVIRKLNDAICTGGESEVFLTLFYGILEPTGRLRYANGAHPYPILRRAGHGPAVLLETTGTVVGIIPDQTYEEREIRLHSGDTLLLYTDGVTEADHDGELFGSERVQALAQEWRGKHPQDLVDTVLHAVREFCGNHIRDDLALLAIRRR